MSVKGFGYVGKNGSYENIGGSVTQTESDVTESARLLARARFCNYFAGCFYSTSSFVFFMHYYPARG
jgi:hypothetical protein